ncbi:MAG TPA: ChaN family lipoprotein [Geobacteraceae bacterium]|nr:ChaN family lipoprotein [Geobacteraceae bacterium]
MKGRLPLIAAFAAAFALFTAAVPCRADRALRLSDRQIIDFKRMITEIRGVRLIFIGEDHDRMEDHWRQSRIIKALHEAGSPLAIGLEMFTGESQAALDMWVAGRMDERTFANIYGHNWDMPWYLYRNIFIYAQGHGIPLIGLNLQREIVHKVAREGFAALTPEERGKLPAGVTCNVDSAYVAMVRRAFAGHGGSDRSFIHFCEAQMLWNKAMARRIAEYCRAHPSTTVIVLAGTGHAMKPGIPSELADGVGLALRVIIPEDATFDRDTATAADADYLLVP